jgi:hippurate hydrolase
VAQAAFGADRVIRETPPVGGAEDFSFYLEKVPGTYLFIGNGDGAHREATYHGMGPCELHNPNYDFNDALLPVGASYWVKLVSAFFTESSPGAALPR